MLETEITFKRGKNYAIFSNSLRGLVQLITNFRKMSFSKALGLFRESDIRLQDGL